MSFCNDASGDNPIGLYLENLIIIHVYLLIMIFIIINVLKLYRPLCYPEMALILSRQNERGRMTKAIAAFLVLLLLS